MSYFFKKYFRSIRRNIFHNIRQCIGIFFGFFLRKVHNIENFPKSGPFIIVSNHLSYLDSLIVSSIFRKQYIVILASNEIKKQPIMSWLSKFNITVFVDFDKNSITSLKEIISLLKRGYIVLVYPEGTRSRNGCMGDLKTGFIKIANSTKVPIIPLAVKGTFDILPPQKIIPSFKRCEFYVGESIVVDSCNKDFIDCFDQNGSLTKNGVEIVAFRVMNKIAKMVNQRWDSNLNVKLRSYGIDV